MTDLKGIYYRTGINTTAVFAENANLKAERERDRAKISHLEQTLHQQAEHAVNLRIELAESKGAKKIADEFRFAIESADRRADRADQRALDERKRADEAIDIVRKRTIERRKKKLITQASQHVEQERKRADDERKRADDERKRADEANAKYTAMMREFGAMEEKVRTAKN